eukprot:403338749
MLRLVCDMHKEYYAEYYCVQCDKIVCFLCSQLHHLTHNGGCLQIVKPQNFKEYHDFVCPLLDKQLEMITNLKNKYSSYINQIEIHLGNDFVSMLNQTKLLLKDFIKHQDYDKLLITHYKLKNQKEPQEELKQQQEFQVANRKQFKIYDQFLNQTQNYTKYYKHFFELVNCELSKSSTSTISTYMKDWNKSTFELLYQGSRDGYEAPKFHQLCDNKGPTIVFAVSECGETFGGYTSVSLTQENKFKEDDQAFIFQLNKRSIHQIEKNQNQAVGHNKDYLIKFGHNSDLCLNRWGHVNQSSWSNLGHSYKLPLGYTYDKDDSKNYLGGRHYFRVLEIEVYSVKLP